jgi:hypothetical protein
MKNYIDFRICRQCKHYKIHFHEGICGLNGLPLNYFFGSNGVFGNVFSSHIQSEIERLDDNCPNKLEHYVKCTNEKIGFTERNR